MPKKEAETGLVKVDQVDLDTFVERNPESIVRTMLDNGGELAPQMVPMKDGMHVHGTFAGFGAPLEMIDAKSGIVRELQTVLVRNMAGNATIALIGNHDLVKKVAKIPEGAEVFIHRKGKRDIGQGRTVVDFDVVSRAAGAKRLSAAS